MARVESAGLPQKIVLEVVKHLKPRDGVLLVGGQAVNLWGDYYSHRSPELKKLQPFTSKDVDYQGPTKAAEKLADALDGEVLRPEFGNATPNVAVVAAHIEGKKIVIDFLGHVRGVSQSDIKKHVVTLNVPIRGQDTMLALPVLHPLHCLQSRITNMLAPDIRRTDELAKRQLKTAELVLREFINEAIESGRPHLMRVARRTLKNLWHYIKNNEFGKRAYNETPVDPLDIIRHFADDSRLEEIYRTRTLRARIQQIENWRKGREKRIAALKSRAKKKS